MAEDYDGFERGQQTRMMARNIIRNRLARLAKTAQKKRGRVVELPVRDAPPSLVYGDGKPRKTTNTLMAELLAKDEL